MRELTLKQNLVFFRQLHTFIRSGTAPITYLQDMQQQVSAPPLKAVVNGMIKAARRGKSLSTGLQSCPNALQKAHLAMFELAEKSGKLEALTYMLAEYFEWKLRMRRKIISSLVYPFILLILAIIIPPVYLIFTKGLMAYVGTVLQALCYIMGPFLILYFVQRAGLDSVKKVFDTLQLHIPVISAMVWRFNLATYFRMFALGIEAGAEVNAVAEYALASLNNTRIKALFEEQRQPNTYVFDPQYQLYPVIKRYPAVYSMVSAGFGTGNITEMMNKTAQYLEEEAQMYLANLIVVLPIFVFLIVAIYIGLIVVRFWSNMYNLIPLE
ncbi:type II secretion system F family protein [bacterium]|nr:type II secretion system F family protein [bacterium]